MRFFEFNTRIKNASRNKNNIIDIIIVFYLKINGVIKKAKKI